MAVSLYSCGGRNGVVGATIDVTVKNAVGDPQQGAKVYMFRDSKPNLSTAPSDALESAVTNSDGIAEFNLNFTQLNIKQENTNLYFAVFYQIGDEKLLAESKGITVKQGDTKEVSLQTLFGAAKE